MKIDKGLILSLAASILVLFLFFGDLLQNLNRVYFDASGDGFQTYYTALYHVNHDSLYWRMNGMNYPYGEQVFFTGCMPMVTNAIILLKPLLDLCPYTIGIINGIMLFSVVFSVLFLYLIFRHFELNEYWSAWAAVAIAFLSPQIDRLGGHFTLTYQFAVPAYFYLLLKFKEKPIWSVSLCVALLTLFMAGTHFYFFGFFALISVVFYSFFFFKKESGFGDVLFIGKHLMLQTILPLLIISSIGWLTDSVSDRTQYPWGYLHYTSNPASILLPSNISVFYRPWLEALFHPSYSSWEGLSYVGFFASLSFIALVIGLLLLIFKKKTSFVNSLLEEKMLLVWLVSGIVGCIISFGFPFSEFKYLLHYSGPIKQMRGIGRFAWIFYYAVNISAVFVLTKWLEKKKSITRNLVMSFALLVLYIDAYSMIKNRQSFYNNSISAIEDESNHTPENNWINEINSSEYQSIITLPYFHVGSENMWYSEPSEILRKAFVVSFKTGLPLNDVLMSRTSLSQTYSSLQPFFEPYRPLFILDKFPNQKPFIVLVDTLHLKPLERNFLKHCEKIANSDSYSIYRLDFNSLQTISDNLYRDAKLAITDSTLTKRDEFLISDTTSFFFFNDFLENQEDGYFSKGVFTGTSEKFNILFQGEIPENTQDYIYSFWVKDFFQDLVPRTTLEITYLDADKKVLKADYYNLGQRMVTFDTDGWALIEGVFSSSCNEAVITVWNDQMKEGGELKMDRLQIRKNSSDCFRKIEKSLEKNNRVYNL